MKNIKKIAVFLAALILNTGISAVALESAEFSYTDDFESYETGLEVTGNNASLTDNWKTSSKSGWDGRGFMGISTMPMQIGGDFDDPQEQSGDVGGNTSNMMWVQGKSAVNDFGSFTGALFVAPEGLTKNFKFSVDMFAGKNSGIKLGVRLYCKNDKSAYYEILFNQSSYTVYEAKASTRTLIANGDRTGRLPDGAWYTMELKTFNGEVSWNLYNKGETTPLELYSGSFYDADIAALESYSDYALQLMAVGAGAQVGYFDNFSIANYAGPWAEGLQPGNQIYRHLNYGKTATDNVFDLGAKSRIRKIVLENASTVTVSASADGETYTSIYDGEVTDGVIINGTDETAYRYVKIEGTYDSAEIYDSVDDTIEIPITGNVALTGRFSGTDKLPGEITWSPADSAVLTADENGVITGNKIGESSLDAICGGTVSTVIKVVPELEWYKANGLETEYIAAKRIVTDTVNEAIRENDSDKMMTVLVSGNECSADIIKDIDFSAVSSLDDPHKVYLATALLDYEPLYGENESPTLDDFDELASIINSETAVYKLENLPTANDVKNIIGLNNEFYGINLEDAVFKAYETEIYEALTNRVFESKKKLLEAVETSKNTFKNTYVMNKVEKNSNYLAVEGILEECADYIGYDKEYYADIEDKEQFAKDFINAKADFKTTEDIRKFIDEYVPEEDDDDDDSYIGGGGYSGGGGGGGGSSITLPATPVVIAPTQQVIDETIKNSKSPFCDITNSHWGYEYIYSLNTKGIINGDENGNVRPDASVSRAEFIKMLLLSFNHNPVEKETNAEETTEAQAMFTDISEADWYYDYMQYAGELGILLGSDGKCNPESALSRQELCTLVYRMLQLSGKTLDNVRSAKNFEDASQIADWALRSVMQLQCADIVSGMTETTFEPHGSATRAQTAKILDKIIKNLDMQALNQIKNQPIEE